MDAKDKAKELVEKYSTLAQSIDWTDNETKLKAEQYNDEIGSDILFYWDELAKRSALISCDFAKEFITGDLSESFDKFLYLEDVKTEINKL